MRVPWSLCRSFREPRTIFRIRDRFAVSALCHLGQEREVQAFERLAAFKGEFRSNPALILQTGNLMTSRAAKVFDPLLPLRLQLGIIHERSVRIGTRLIPLQ